MTETAVETRYRSIIKALSWRFFATLITFFVAWLLTGKIDIACKIGAVDMFLKLAAYYSHERAWNGIGFGKKKRPEYQI